MPSTVIRRFAYDSEREELLVEFVTGRRYVYRDVPIRVADDLRAAFSKGRHFNANIRDRYEYSECADMDGTA